MISPPMIFSEGSRILKRAAAPPAFSMLADDAHYFARISTTLIIALTTRHVPASTVMRQLRRFQVNI